MSDGKGCYCQGGWKCPNCVKKWEQKESDLRKLEEEWRKYEKIMLDDYQVALSDWDEGVLWTTKKIKKLLDGGG